MTEILNYLNFNPTYQKDSAYLKIIKSILDILGYQLTLGTLVMQNNCGKNAVISSIPQYRVRLLSNLFPSIQEEIYKNINKMIDYDSKKR